MAVDYRLADSPEAAHREILDWCGHALNDCRSSLERNPRLDYKGCIDQEKDNLKRMFAFYEDMYGLSVTNIVEDFNWNPPAQGGKRKRRTRHRKRFHKKNRTRRHRRVRMSV